MLAPLGHAKCGLRDTMTYPRIVLVGPIVEVRVEKLYWSQLEVHVINKFIKISMHIDNPLGQGPGADPEEGRRRAPPPYTLKSPLNWLKFTKKSRGQAPKARAPPFSDPGAATDFSIPNLPVTITERVSNLSRP